MLIKDKSFWKEYNQKRREKGYFKQNYLQKKVVNSPEVVKSEIVVKSLQPDNGVVKNQTNILQPKENKLCSNCPKLEKQLQGKEKQNQPCQLNHTLLPELFQKLQEKVQQEYQPASSRKCFDCHNYENNYQIMVNLLDKYWTKAKKGEKSM